jgi:hypothetical protein
VPARLERAISDRRAYARGVCDGDGDVRVQQKRQQQKMTATPLQEWTSSFGISDFLGDSNGSEPIEQSLHALGLHLQRAAAALG